MGNKFRNKPTSLDGYRFDSKKEASRYVVLREMQDRGDISGLQIHTPFSIVVNGALICKYVCDFVYYLPDGVQVVEDVKGKRTREYILKRKLMAAVHGIQIKET